MPCFPVRHFHHRPTLPPNTHHTVPANAQEYSEQRGPTCIQSMIWFAFFGCPACLLFPCSNSCLVYNTAGCRYGTGAHADNEILRYNLAVPDMGGQSQALPAIVTSLTTRRHTDPQNQPRLIPTPPTTQQPNYQVIIFSRLTQQLSSTKPCVLPGLTNAWILYSDPANHLPIKPPTLSHQHNSSKSQIPTLSTAYNTPPT